MKRSLMKLAMPGLAAALLLPGCCPTCPTKAELCATPRARTTTPRPAPGLAEGKVCKSTSQCKKGLTCANQRCSDVTGKHPACRWSLACLAKMKTRYKGSNEGYELNRWHIKLSKMPYKPDCMEMPKRVAILLYDKPYLWKRLCGPPPVPKVKKTRVKTHPFRILDKQIKASGIPRDEKAEIHMKHQRYVDLCKAWVQFQLKRPFQGWVVARVYEQYDCDAKRYQRRLKDPNLEPKCKSRLYKRSDRRYIYLHDKGTKFSMSFYFSTPPQVCKKPNLTNKYYKTGCFCLGINTQKLTLEFIEDPFLYNDEMKR